MIDRDVIGALLVLLVEYKESAILTSSSIIFRLAVLATLRLSALKLSE